MKNEFMHTLSRELLFSVSYLEMRDVVNDYLGFETERVPHETPKEIAKAVCNSKKRLIVTGCLLAGYTMLNICAFLFVGQNNYMETSHKCIFLFLASCLFVWFFCVLFGKKVFLMSQFCETNQYEKGFIVITNTFILI